MEDFNIKCGEVRTGETGVKRSWDVYVTVCYGPHTRSGELTLVESGSGEGPNPYGDPAHWISGDLLVDLGRDLDDDEFRACVLEVAATASKAINASGVEASR